jgi:hypothetical protein
MKRARVSGESGNSSCSEISAIYSFIAVVLLLDL